MSLLYWWRRPNPERELWALVKGTLKEYTEGRGFEVGRALLIRPRKEGATPNERNTWLAYWGVGSRSTKIYNGTKESKAFDAVHKRAGVSLKMRGRPRLNKPVGLVDEATEDETSTQQGA